MANVSLRLDPACEITYVVNLSSLHQLHMQIRPNNVNAMSQQDRCNKEAWSGMHLVVVGKSSGKEKPTSHPPPDSRCGRRTCSRALQSTKLRPKPGSCNARLAHAKTYQGL